MSHVTRSSQQTRAPIVRTFLCLMRRTAILAALAALLTGCIFVDGTSSGSSIGGGSSMTSGSGMTGGGSSMDMPTAPVSRLPQPDVWRVKLPALDADQLKRLDEVEQFVAAQYQAAGWQIEATTQSFVGDLYDWIDVNSIEGSQEEPPPAPTPEEMQLPDGVQPQLTELDAFPELRGPEGTVPVLRPSFAAYVLGFSGATSLEDFLTSYVVPGDPSGGAGRLYAGMITFAPNQGANVTINSYDGIIEPGTMSVLEMVVGCRNPTDPPNAKRMWQYIGIASSRDWANEGFQNFGDFTLRLQVEFFTAGTSDDALGPGKGGWAGTRSVTDFIPYKDAPYGPGAAFAPETLSTVGGSQYESLYQIKNVGGNWWVGHNGYWLGYYPRKLFDGAPPVDPAISPNLLASQACEVDWYGEVFDRTPETWTWTDMGSGRFAADGWGNAAYFRAPSYVSLDAAATWSWPDSDPNVMSIDAPGFNNACYTKTALGSGPAPWERFFYVGGPGGLALDGGGSTTCQ